MNTYREPKPVDKFKQCIDCKHFEEYGELSHTGGIYGDLCHLHVMLVNKLGTCDKWEGKNED